MHIWRRELYLIWFYQILGITGFNLCFPFLPFLIPTLGNFTDIEVQSWTGILASAPSFGIMIMAPIWGWLSDKIPPKIMLLRALIASAIILILLSFASNIHQVLILRILQGFLSGTVGASATWVAMRTPSKHLSYALGFLSSSTFIGATIGPAMGGFLSDIIGYQMTFFWGGVIIFLGFLGVLFSLKSTAIEKTTLEEKQKEKNISRSKEKFSHLLIYGLLFMLALRFLRSSFPPFLPFHLQALLPNSTRISTISGLVIASAGAVVALANITLSHLGDKHPKKNLLLIYISLAGLGTLPLFFIHKISIFTIAYLFSLFFLGSCEPLVSSRLTTLVSKQNRGKLFGWQASIGAVGWFLAPIIGTYVLIKSSTFHLFLFLSISLFILAITLTLFKMLFFKKYH